MSETTIEAPAKPGNGWPMMSDLDKETLWPEVPADAKPGDDGLINELSAPQRLALPAAFHRPVWDDLGRPNLWHCAVCWGDGWFTKWPCEAASTDGGSVVLDPKAVVQARAEGAAGERRAIITWLGEMSRAAGVGTGPDYSMSSALGWLQRRLLARKGPS
jgi:hypothetical protein